LGVGRQKFNKYNLLILCAKIIKILLYLLYWQVFFRINPAGNRPVLAACFGKRGGGVLTYLSSTGKIGFNLIKGLLLK
jgi:hypothetical protein